MSRKAQIKKNLKRGAFSHGPRYGGPQNGRPFGKSSRLPNTQPWGEPAPKIKGTRYL